MQGTQERQTTKQEYEVNLIEDALAHFCLSECPHCQEGVSPEHYINQVDIEKWLKERS